MADPLPEGGAPVAAPATPVTPSSVAPDTGGAAPGPVAGTPAAGTVAPEAPAPAADSSPASEAAPAKTEAPGGGDTLLTQAQPEAAPEQPAEPEKPVERPIPTYDAFATPEGVKLGDEQVGKFSGLLGEYENKLAADPTAAHAMMQELGQKLVDFYLAESQEANQRYAKFQNDTWTQTRQGWVKQFREDPDIGGSRQDTTLRRCGDMLALYGREAGAEKEAALRDVFTLTGAGDHPELLRFINWAANRAVEDSRIVAAPPRPLSAGATRANRLYRNSISGGA